MMTRIGWVIVIAMAMCGVYAGTGSAATASRGPEVKVSQDAAARMELEAAGTELRRAVSNLRVTHGPAPYLGEARLSRAALMSLDGSFGGLVTDMVDRQAIGTAEIKVGSPTRDNSNFLGSSGGVTRLEIALDPSAAFLRRKLWLSLDQSFRGAVAQYIQKSNALKRLAEGQHQPADRTAAGATPVVKRLSDPLTTTFERVAWAELVCRLSARFVDAPQIDNGDVHFQVLRTRESVVDSDGMMLQWARERAVLAVVADTRAADGMRLDHGRALHFQAVPVLEEGIIARGESLVDDVLEELDALAKAPVIDEEYDGPILFRGAAAAQLLASTVAPEASGTPAPLGQNGRFVELEPAWHKRVQKVVMPPFVDIVDDPTQRGGFGSYRRDAEGVEATRVVLVRAGVLRRLLMTRTPNAEFSQSNGRARMSPSLEVGPAISNLELVSRRPGRSARALERELLTRAHEDGYEFGYVVELMRDGSLLGPVPRDSATAFAGTGKLNLPLPARVFRIGAGGRRTLVRGAVLAPASIRVLRRIRAVGRRRHTEWMRIPVGAYGGWSNELAIEGVLVQTVDAQVTTPDLLVEGLELLVERGEHERLPTLVHPLRRNDEAPPGALSAQALCVR